MRMEGRRPRLHRRDIEVKSAQELCRLADHLGIDTSGCLEKEELVNRIALSGKVVIVADEQHDDQKKMRSSEAARLPMESVRSCTVGTTRNVTESELSTMSVRDLKATIRNAGISTDDCIEKSDLLQRLRASGLVSVFGDAWDATSSHAPTVANGPSVSETIAGAKSASFLSTTREGELRPSCGVAYAGYSVRELRKLAVQLGVSLDGCLEKAEIMKCIETVLGPPCASAIQWKSSPVENLDSLDNLMSNMSGSPIVQDESTDTIVPHSACGSCSATSSAGSRPGSPALLQAGGALLQVR